ncbi:MAG: hypothetical protein HY927_14620 [Elusimicrobia bacterium]|nr:hypothetical protein [Elusimicrobiota bacterium]
MARLATIPAAFSCVLMASIAASSVRSWATEDCVPAGEVVRLSSLPGFQDKPLTTLVRDVSIADDCKRQILASLSSLLQIQSDKGMCPQGRCGRLPGAAGAMAGFAVSGDAPLCLEESSPDGGCAPNPVHEQAFKRLEDAEPHVTAMIEEGLEVILRKIAFDRVPYCLLPQQCLEDDVNACRDALRIGWWLDMSHARGREEVWLHPGGFVHLLLGEAFTCSPGLQRGGTCAIYSAAALMSHYCATPLRNPASKSECVQPPGVRCVGAQEFLQKALDPGCWEAKVCRPGQRCDPVVDAPSGEAQARLRAQMDELGCGRTASPSARCVELRQRLRPGQTGAFLSCIEKIYKHFGFRTVFYPPDDGGWARARRSLDPRDPHPVQVHINPESWSLYGGNGSDHAVVLEALWSHRGVERVLLRDSNNPFLTVLPVSGENGVRQTFFDRGGGGVGLCFPGDARRCPN